MKNIAVLVVSVITMSLFISCYDGRDARYGAKTYYAELGQTAARSLDAGDGTFLVIGSINANSSFYNIWLARSNEEGTLLWERSIGTSGVEDSNLKPALVNRGNGVFSAVFRTRVTTDEVFSLCVVDVNINGAILSQKMYTFDADCAPATAMIDQSGNLLIGGYISREREQALLVSVASDGSLNWAAEYNYSVVNALTMLDGAIYAVGVNRDFDPEGYYDAIVTRIDGNGQCVWSRSICESNVFCELTSLVSDGSSLYAAGSRATWNGSSSVKDLMLAKFSMDGMMLANTVYNCGGSSDVVTDLFLNGAKLLAAIDSNRSGKDRACLGTFGTSLAVESLNEFAPCSGHASSVMTTSAGIALAGYSGSKALFIGTDATGNVPGVSWVSSLSVSSVSSSVVVRSVSLQKSNIQGLALQSPMKSGSVKSTVTVY